MKLKTTKFRDGKKHHLPGGRGYVTELPGGEVIGPWVVVDGLLIWGGDVSICELAEEPSKQPAAERPTKVK